MKRLKAVKGEKEARREFVRYWADFVRSHPDEEWGRQQAVLINSMMANARFNQLKPKEYLKIKREIY